VARGAVGRRARRCARSAERRRRDRTRHVVGGGLAGCEAAYHLARAGWRSTSTRCGPTRDRGARERPAGRARVLELVSERDARDRPSACSRTRCGRSGRW
jgi:hypothetical protein